MRSTTSMFLAAGVFIMSQCGDKIEMQRRYNANLNRIKVLQSKISDLEFLVSETSNEVETLLDQIQDECCPCDQDHGEEEFLKVQPIKVEANIQDFDCLYESDSGELIDECDLGVGEDIDIDSEGYLERDMDVEIENSLEEDNLNELENK